MSMNGNKHNKSECLKAVFLITKLGSGDPSRGTNITLGIEIALADPELAKAISDLLQKHTDVPSMPIAARNELRALMGLQPVEVSEE